METGRRGDTGHERPATGVDISEGRDEDDAAHRAGHETDGSEGEPKPGAAQLGHRHGSVCRPSRALPVKTCGVKTFLLSCENFCQSLREWQIGNRLFFASITLARKLKQAGIFLHDDNAHPHRRVVD